MKHSITIALLFCLGLGAAEAATHIYVSPSGNDMNDGSKKRPLRTPVQALMQAREKSRRDTLFIHLEDGVYRLEETLNLRAEDSGSAESPTVIMAENPGKAVFSGGMPLDMTDRMESLNWWMGHPVAGHRTLNVRQLWRGGKKLPHASVAPLDSLMELSGISKERRELWISAENFDPVLDLIYGTRLGFAEDENNMKIVKSEELRGLELVACTERTMSVLRVKNFQLEGSIVKLTFLEPESHLLFSQKEMPRYYNLFGDYSIVIPGTWYQDPKDGSIVYDPDEYDRSLDAQAQAKETFTVPVLERLVRVAGENDRPVHHIIFRGLRFEYSSWIRPSYQGVVTVPGGEYSVTGGYTDRQEAAVLVQNGQNIEFADCQFLHLAATAIDFEPGCVRGSVTGCSFVDIGGSAIATPQQPARRGFHIQRNSFEDIGNEIWFSDAIRY